MIDFFNMILRLHSTIKKWKNVLSKYQNIKPFLDLYNSKVKEYLVPQHKINYILFEKHNPEITITLQYVDVNVEIVQTGKGQRANIYINQSNSCMHLIIIKKEKKQFCY